MLKYDKISWMIIVFVLVVMSFWGSVSAAGVGNNTTANVTNSTGLADSDWPSFQNDANKTGQSNYTGPQTNTTKWTFDNITVYGSAVIGKNGKIYIAGNDGILYTFSSKGILLWTYTTRSSIYGSPSIGSDGVVYISNWMNSTTYALSSDGSLIWKYSTGGYNFGSSPVIGFDGTVYVGVTNDTNGTLYALTPSGAVKWSYVMGLIYGISPVIGSDGTVYMADYDGVIYAINHDGSLKWSYRLKYYDPNVYVDYFVNMYYNTLSLGSDGTIYIACHNGRFISGPIVNRIMPEYGVLFALTDMGDGAVRKWSYNVGEALFGAPAVSSDGKIYVVGASGLHALDLNGNVLWSYVTGLISETGSTSAAIGKDGTIYFGSGSGLYALKPDGDLKWSYATGSVIGSPAIGSDGTLYIGSINGTFYAFNDIAADFVVESVKGTVLTQQFTGITTGNPQSWKWDFGDGTTSTSQNPSHTYSKAGNYNITLTVTLKDGSKVLRIKNITIEEKDIVAPTVNNNLNSGTYYDIQYVTLTAEDNVNNTVIYYTLDGSDPLTSITRIIYSNPIEINDIIQLKYAAVDPSGNWSPIYTENYTILGSFNVEDASYYDENTINSDIQAIFDSAKPGSRIVFLGKLYENLQLVINKPLYLLSNVGTEIDNSLSGSAVFLINGMQAAGTRISGFNIVTNATSGILVNNSSDITISNVKVKAANGTAITINGSSNCIINNSSLTDSSTGINISDSDNTQINGCTISGNKKRGIGIYNSTNTVVNNSTFGSNGDNNSAGIFSDEGAIYIENSDDVKVTNNQINMNSQGVTSRDSSDVIIYNNLIKNNYGEGILLSGYAENIAITWNHIEENANGIQINYTGGGNIILQSNVIANSFENEAFDGNVENSGNGINFGHDWSGTGISITSNVIYDNEHRDIDAHDEQNYEESQLFVGVNVYTNSNVDINNKFCCKINSKAARLVVESGEGIIRAYFIDPNTNKIITDIPSIPLTIILNNHEYTVWTDKGIAILRVSPNELNDYIKAIFKNNQGIISALNINNNNLDGKPEGLQIITGTGGDDNSGSTDGDGSGGNSGSGTNSGNPGNNGGNSGSLALGAAASSSGAGGSTSSSNQGGSSKTVRELILNQNSPIWGILGIIILIIIVTGAYYRNDIMNMIEKSRK